MYSDYSCFDSHPVTSGQGHLPWQCTSLSQATVIPADLSLAQPSHGPTQSYGIPYNNVTSTGYNFVGYPAVDRTSQGAPAWLSHPIGHTSDQCSVINDVPSRHFTLPLTPIGGMPMPRVTCERICEWISEDGLICGQTISERTVSKDLAQHGIHGMHRNHMVQCGWRGCGKWSKRQSIARHVREVHLGLKRRSRRYAFPWDDFWH